MIWTLANPLFLWLLPLAGLPVLFHLFLKIRKRPRPFTTLMFFQRIDPHLSARKRLREYLILALRCLLILLALLALAGPIWLGAAGGGSVSLIAIVDNSGSMSGPSTDGQPKRKHAAAGAAALLAALRTQDTGAILLLVDDPSVPLPEGLTADKKSLAAALDRIADTEASASPATAIERAFALIDASPASRFQIHIFTDLAKEKWGTPPAALKSPRPGTSLIVHRIRPATDPLPNAAITRIALAQQRAIAGRPAPIDVTLANQGSTDTALRLVSLDDAGKTATQEVALSKGAEKIVTLVASPDSPGDHWMLATIENDGFAADNRAAITFRAENKLPVVFVGEPRDFGTLPLALAPATDGQFSGLLPSFTAPAGSAGAIADKKPACVIATFDALASGTSVESALRAYVVNGGNLLLLPASNTTATPRLPAWTGVAPEPGRTQEGGFPVVVFAKSAPILKDLKDEKGEPALTSARLFQTLTFKPEKTATALLGLEDGSPVLLQTPLGKGNLFVCGFAAEPRWSNLPLKPGFVVLAQNIALAGHPTNERETPLVAGQRLREAPGSAPSLRVRSVAGGPLDWQGKRSSLPVLAHAGVFAVAAGNETLSVAARAADSEGKPAFITGNNVPALGPLAHTVKDYQGPGTMAAEAAQMHRALDLYAPLLLLALLALLAEGWLANKPYRKTIPAPPQPAPEGALHR